MEDYLPKRLSDGEAIKLICNICNCNFAQEIKKWEWDKRDEAIRMAIGAGISARQLSRITAISRYTIGKIIEGGC